MQDEFMIQEDTSVAAVTDATGASALRAWGHSFTLRSAHCPAFLQQYAQRNLEDDLPSHSVLCLSSPVGALSEPNNLIEKDPDTARKGCFPRVMDIVSDYVYVSIRASR